MHQVTTDPRLLPAKPRLRGWIHTVLVPLSLAASLVLLILAPTVALRWACLIYLAASLTLFTVSALYHRVGWKPTMMKVMRRWDHSNIFLLIAGSYTPIAVAGLEQRECTILLTIVWIGALAGIALSIFWPLAPRLLYVPIYIGLGWVALIYLPALWANVGPVVVWLLFAEGIAYTIGGLIYGFKWPDPSPTWFGFHELFHAFTGVGWICHCVAAYFAVLGTPFVDY